MIKYFSSTVPGILWKYFNLQDKKRRSITIGINLSLVPSSYQQIYQLQINEKDRNLGMSAMFWICSSTAGGDVKGYNCYQGEWGKPTKTTHHLPLDPAILLLGIYLEDKLLIIQGLELLNAALCVIAKYYKQLITTLWYMVHGV